MKLQWETPRIEIEAFEANEYVSACYSIKCQVGTQGFTTTYGDHTYTEDELWGSWTIPNGLTESQYYGSAQSDHNTTGTSGTCNDPASNFITVDSNNNYSFYEQNNEQGHLNGEITNAFDLNGNGIGAGDLIAWVTYNATYYWRHWAYAQASDASHPNRS